MSPRRSAAKPKATRAKPMAVVTLRDWAVRPGSDSPFKAPETAGIRLTGCAYGHPVFPDGHAVTTSRVTGVDGRRITVESGRVYVLEGAPEQAYLDWLAKEGRRYDAERPIVVKQIERAGS